VIAAVFSETYKRNAFNNGFVVLSVRAGDAPAQDARNRQPTTVGPEITIDYAKSILSIVEKSFPFPPLSPAAQELIVAGGAENLVASRCAKSGRGSARVSRAGEGVSPSRTFPNRLERR